MASIRANSFVPRRPPALRAGVYALHLLAAALMSATAGAQDDSELARLIFEVAPIPADEAVAGTGTTRNGGTGANQAGATAAADTDEPRSVQADITAYRARISDIQANANPYSTELREQYDALGTLLQQTGDHEEAIEAFEAAMHIDRVNAGLYTLDQIPLVERIIASHEALGNASDVYDLHGYLFYIQQKSFAEGDPRLLAAQEAWADWNVASYMADNGRDGSSITFNAGMGRSIDYVAVQDPRSGAFVYIPRSQMMGAMNPFGRGIFDPTTMQTYGVDAERVIDERLREARMYYEEIVEATAPEEEDAESTADTRIPPGEAELRVERKLAAVAYAIKEQFANIDTIDDPTSLYYGRAPQNYSPPLAVTRGYTHNRDALEATAAALEQDSAVTPEQKAQAWIDLGDWHVAFDYGSRGDDAYRKAWEILTAAGRDEAAIAALLMPELLVPVPGFAIHKYSRETYGIDPNASIDYKGHMDLTLSVNRYGDVSGVRIDSAVPEISQNLRSELVDYLREQKVRPALVNGETVRREDVKLRYYYSY